MEKRTAKFGSQNPAKEATCNTQSGFFNNMKNATGDFFDKLGTAVLEKRGSPLFC